MSKSAGMNIHAPDKALNKTSDFGDTFIRELYTLNFIANDLEKCADNVFISTFFHEGLNLDYCMEMAYSH